MSDDTDNQLREAREEIEALMRLAPVTIIAQKNAAIKLARESVETLFHSNIKMRKRIEKLCRENGILTERLERAFPPIPQNRPLTRDEIAARLHNAEDDNARRYWQEKVDNIDGVPPEIRAQLENLSRQTQETIEAKDAERKALEEKWKTMTKRQKNAHYKALAKATE